MCHQNWEKEAGKDCKENVWNYLLLIKHLNGQLEDCKTRVQLSVSQVSNSDVIFVNKYHGHINTVVTTYKSLS